MSVVSTKWPSTLTSEVSNILFSWVWNLPSVLTLVLLKNTPRRAHLTCNPWSWQTGVNQRFISPMLYISPEVNGEAGSKFRNNSMKHMNYNPIDLELLWSGYHFLKVTIGLKELIDLVKARLKGKAEEYTVTQYPFPCYRIPFGRMQRKNSWMVNEHMM